MNHLLIILLLLAMLLVTSGCTSSNVFGDDQKFVTLLKNFGNSTSPSLHSLNTAIKSKDWPNVKSESDSLRSVISQKQDELAKLHVTDKYKLAYETVNESLNELNQTMWSDGLVASDQIEGKSAISDMGEATTHAEKYSRLIGTATSEIQKLT